MSLMRWIREMLHGGVEKTGQAAAEHAARDVPQSVPAASAPAPQPLLKPDDDDLLAENMGDIVPLALEIARLNAPAGSDADVHQNKKEAEINEVSQKSELQPSDSARGAASPVPVSGAAAAQQKKLPDRLTVISAVIALIGVGFLTLKGDHLGFSVGEMFIILDALFYSITVLITDWAAKNDDPMTVPCQRLRQSDSPSAGAKYTYLFHVSLRGGRTQTDSAVFFLS